MVTRIGPSILWCRKLILFFNTTFWFCQLGVFILLYDPVHTQVYYLFFLVKKEANGLYRLKFDRIWCCKSIYVFFIYLNLRFSEEKARFLNYGGPIMEKIEDIGQIPKI